MQNTSHAVMAQRSEPRDSLDYFPTPPWATRALLEHVITVDPGMSCLEPACGAGHMARALGEYFRLVTASDIEDRGFGVVMDFLSVHAGGFDWVITNPPFSLAEEFVHKALTIANCGVAILARTVFVESVGRYHRLFSLVPPTKIAQFTERVPMVKGRLDRKASTATGYAWFVWMQPIIPVLATRMMWIPPCRKSLERNGDYGG